MIVMSTPVYESVRVAALEGIPAATGYPPHHPDILAGVGGGSGERGQWLGGSEGRGVRWRPIRGREHGGCGVASTRFHSVALDRPPRPLCGASRSAAHDL
jgi:hypothetical protein